MSSFQPIIDKLRINQPSRHIFLCCVEGNSKCCQAEESLRSWDYLKKRVEEINAEGHSIFLRRTKANCLRVCMQGPVAVVYPEGVWYHSCTVDVLEQVIQRHLIRGEILREYQIC